MTPGRFVHLHGRVVAEEDAHISPFDRGFLLGDGVFETMRAYGGRVFLFDDHAARLRASCAAARLPFPDGLREAVADTLEANGLTEAAVRVTVTRGPGGRGASPKGAGPATVLVTATRVPYDDAMYSQGMRLATAKRRRVGADSLDPSVKSIDYLVHVLARAEAEDEGADEALFLDANGHVVEATQSNVFAILGRELIAPPLSSGCLPGISRATLMGLAPDVDLVPRERALTLADLSRADEVLLSASVLEVCGVVALDGAPIGTGEVGPRTRALRAAYRALTTRHG